MKFIRQLNNSVRGISTDSSDIFVSENVKEIIGMLDLFQVTFLLIFSRSLFLISVRQLRQISLGRKKKHKTEMNPTEFFEN